ncbi:MAG: DNA-binding protein [Bacillota bacterium]|nr:DNA-binding protein [Bacillota bacterium]
MFKMFKIALLSLIIILTASTVTFAQDITNFNDLIENGKAFDGKTVMIKGEAVGEIMKRGDYSWINISDGSNAIGIWGETSIIDRVTALGNYKQKGDIVKIQGEFHRACSEHGGDMDIHIKSLSVIEKGNKVIQPIDYNKVKILALLSLTALIAAAVYFKKRKMTA